MKTEDQIKAAIEAKESEIQGLHQNNQRLNQMLNENVAQINLANGELKALKSIVEQTGVKSETSNPIT